MAAGEDRPDVGACGVDACVVRRSSPLGALAAGVGSFLVQGWRSLPSLLGCCAGWGLVGRCSRAGRWARECCGVVDVIGPAPAGGAHVGFQRGSGSGWRWQTLGSTSACQDVADRADVCVVFCQRATRPAANRCTPSGRGSARPAPARPVSSGWGVPCTCVRVLGELLPTEGKR